MNTKFEAVMAKLLKRFLNDVVFVDLKPENKAVLAGLNAPANATLPLFIEDLAVKIKENDMDEIPVVALIKGLVYAVGAQAELPYRPFYIDLLKHIDPEIGVRILSDGIRFAEEGQYSNAILYFNTVLAMDHESIDALYNMGRAFDDLCDKEARSDLRVLSKWCYEKTITIDPSFAYGHFSLGFALYNDEKFSEAQRHWLSALNGDLPEEMREELVVGLGKVKDRATYERGYELILAGRVEEGLELLKALEDDHDEWWNLLFFIGLGYRMLEQYEDALGYFLKVMTLNTGHIKTMNEIAICLLSLGDFTEAERYLKEAIRLSPENSELLCNMGIVHLQKGDQATARIYFDRAHEASPDDEVVAMWLAHINQKMI